MIIQGCIEKSIVSDCSSLSEKSIISDRGSKKIDGSYLWDQDIRSLYVVDPPKNIECSWNILSIIEFGIVIVENFISKLFYYYSRIIM